MTTIRITAAVILAVVGLPALTLSTWFSLNKIQFLFNLTTAMPIAAAVQSAALEVVSWTSFPLALLACAWALWPHRQSQRGARIAWRLVSLFLLAVPLGTLVMTSMLSARDSEIPPEGRPVMASVMILTVYFPMLLSIVAPASIVLACSLAHRPREPRPAQIPAEAS